MADPKTRKGDSMTTSFIGPDGVPDLSAEEVAGLALEGAMLRGILTQPPHLWQDMLAAVAAGQWRARLEVVEDADGPDLNFLLEIQVSDGWDKVMRVRRAQLGLPRLAGDYAHLRALQGQDEPLETHFT